MSTIIDGRLAQQPHSILERRFLRLLDNASLPRPPLQHPLRLPSGRIVYLDAAYVEIRLAFEIDGHGLHATRRQRASDNTRASAIVDLGWRLHRFTYEQVTNDGATVVRTVRRALESGSCDT